METATKTKVTVQATVNAPVEKVWKLWSTPEDITQWNAASDDWHTPWAKNDLRVGGAFTARMEAKDGSFGFEFGGIYDSVETNHLIEYTLGDGRKVEVIFESKGDVTEVIETFEAENTHPVEFQKAGWQAIMDNFKKYAETH